ncbi:GNAT family N-acetyltransferase [Rheinheimera sp. 1928-s]|uniref:GNAT family N-acetyltransferase n=1 Tax=Rheinheimera sp. 1928-s TaxID=3033803 RepID=UPI00260F2E1D|nr:GNAT family N-acetyltransferase [Rheinheimera sp. 1928-s]MDF3123445.1 GNAT family N-acetyltransferase [Rheinheimera sp. 1928-s]
MVQELNQIFELSTRIATAEDELFFEQLFCSTREFFYELQLPPEITESLLKQQYRLQQSSYKAEAPNAVTYWLGLSEQPVGKVMLNSTASEILIMDLAFIKTMRSKGYGSAVLDAIKQKAAATGVRVRLSVDKNNVRAKKLYLQHGFVITGSSESHEFMFWSGTKL